MNSIYYFVILSLISYYRCYIIPYAINRFKRKKKFVVLHTNFERVNTEHYGLRNCNFRYKSNRWYLSKYIFLVSFVSIISSPFMIKMRASLTSKYVRFDDNDWQNGIAYMKLILQFMSSSNKGKHPYFTRLAKSGLSPNLRSHGN